MKRRSGCSARCTNTGRVETIVNYHKNGTPYWVEIAITPIFDDAGQPLWLVAREREVTDRVAA